MLIPNETHKRGNSDKITRYGWTLADEPGELRWIKKERLRIDHSYQRDAVQTDPKVKRIASEWSWVACGALIVALRDKSYFVIDGHHRASAAMKRSDISTLPCIVFRSSGAKDEASGFLRANKHRKPMSSIDSFKALVTSGSDDAKFVQELVQSRGLVVKQTGKGNFSAPGILLKLAQLDRARAKRVFHLAADICLPGGIHNEILKGLAMLDARLVEGSISDRRIRDRLIAVGRAELIRSMAQAKAFRGIGGERVLAEGLLNAINHRLRIKVEANL